MQTLNGLETVSNCIEDKQNIYLKLFALLYADDTVLMAETHDDLQNILNKFGEYCNNWRLKANTDKTKVIFFSRGRQSTNLKFTLNGSELEIVNEFNYLGILFNRTGNVKAIKKYAKKATKAMFEVLKRGRAHNSSIECQLELLNKMVKPTRCCTLRHAKNTPTHSLVSNLYISQHSLPENLSRTVNRK